MPKIKIDRDRCKGCELCVVFCPKGLIGRDNAINKRGVSPAVFMVKNTDQCLGCSFCAIICPDSCIEVYK